MRLPFLVVRDGLVATSRVEMIRYTRAAGSPPDIE
jgi:hypothetical protein